MSRRPLRLARWLRSLLLLAPVLLLAAGLPSARAQPACSNSLFVVQLEDRPDGAALRQRLGPEHRRWVAAMAGRIVAAGSLHPQPAAPAQGGLWLVRADDVAEVRELVQQDPFWRGGLRRSLEIRLWCRGFPAGPLRL